MQSFAWHTLPRQLQKSLTRHLDLIMAGPAKRRGQIDNRSSGSSHESSSRSAANSIPRFDGNRDPTANLKRAIDYTVPNDLKNLSELLGMSGWDAVRGVSAMAFLLFKHKHTR